MRKAGGRLFVDVTRLCSLRRQADRRWYTLGLSDPLIKRCARDYRRARHFIKSSPDDYNEQVPIDAESRFAIGFRTQVESDLAIVAELIRRSQTSVGELKRGIQVKSGSELMDFIQEVIQELQKILFDRKAHVVFMAAMDASCVDQ